MANQCIETSERARKALLPCWSCLVSIHFRQTTGENTRPALGCFEKSVYIFLNHPRFWMLTYPFRRVLALGRRLAITPNVFRKEIYVNSRNQKWQYAQLGELEWWMEIADKGYDGRSRDDFVMTGQRGWMLSQLSFLDKPLDSWRQGTVIEFGSGPAGMVEYIEAKQKIAFEPLINEYRKVFPHIEKSNVAYHNSPAENIGRQFDHSADLVICFNVLDNTRNPDQIIKNLARVAKKGADLLFQVNVYLSNDQMKRKRKRHAEMYPHSFLPEKILEMLTLNQFEIRKQSLSKEPDANGEYFFICAGVKI